MGGKFAYDVYSEAVGGFAWNGEKLKEFDELPHFLKSAWEKVFLSCIEKYSNNISPNRLIIRVLREYNAQKNKIAEMERYKIDAEYWRNKYDEWQLNTMNVDTVVEHLNLAVGKESQSPFREL